MLSWLLRCYGRLPYHRGKWRVAGLALRLLPGLTNFRGRVRRSGFDFEVDCGSNAVDLSITYLGVYEWPEIRALRDLIRPGDCVLDVGANVGYNALWFGRMVGEKGEVHCFEPFAGTFARLERNLAINGMRHIKPWQLALSDKDGSVAGVELRSTGSYVQKREESLGETADIAAMSVDSFVDAHLGKRVNFMKVDVEGTEMDVLSGAEETIAGDRPGIMVELNPEALQRNGMRAGDVVGRLRDRGYEVFLPRGRRLGRVQGVPEIARDSYLNVLALPVEGNTGG